MKVKKYEEELKTILKCSVLKRDEITVNYIFDYCVNFVSFDFCVN